MTMRIRDLLMAAALGAGWLAGCAPVPDVPADDRPGVVAEALQVGTALDDELTSVLVVEGGDLVVSGYENGLVGSENLEPAGNARGFVRRLDGDGKVVWDARFETSGADTVEQVIPKGKRAFAVVGPTTGAFPGMTNAGQYDGFFATVREDGTIARVSQFGDERPQHPRSMALLDGTFVAGGYDDVYVPSNYVESWENPTIVRDPLAEMASPEQKWTRRLNTSWSDYGHAIVAHPQHGLFMAGQAVASSNRGALLWKFGPEGGLAWTLRFSNVGVDAALAATMADDGDLLVAGSSFLSLGRPNAGEQDPFLAKVDPDTGAIRWTSMNGTRATEWVRAMAVDARGRTWVTGECFDQRLDADFFVARFEADGTPSGYWTGGTRADESAQGIAVDGDTAVVVGWTQGDLSGTGSKGRRDGFVFRVTNDMLGKP